MQAEIYSEFIELVVYGGYSAAARALNISQSQLSRHIAAFERELGCDLVAGTAPLRLTPAGKVVYKIAGQIVDLQREMQEQANSFAIERESIIRIDSRSMESMRIVLLRAINETGALRANADIRLMSPSPGLTPMEAVAIGECDMSIDYYVVEGEPIAGSTRCEELGVCSRNIPAGTGRLQLAILPDSPLLDEKPCLLSLFANEQFILMGDRTHDSFKQTFTDACVRRGFVPHINRIQVDTYDELYVRNQGAFVYFLYVPPTSEASVLRDELMRRRAVVTLDESENLWIETRILFREDKQGTYMDDLVELLCAPCE